MSEDTLILEKRSRTVRLGDRSFIMREMGADEYRRYTKALIEAGKDAKDRLSGSDRSLETIDAALKVAAETELLLLMDLLKEPTDQSKPADEAFLRGLSYSQRIGIFSLQDDLNGTKDLLKNLASLLD